MVIFNCKLLVHQRVSAIQWQEATPMISWALKTDQPLGPKMVSEKVHQPPGHPRAKPSPSHPTLRWSQLQRNISLMGPFRIRNCRGEMGGMWPEHVHPEVKLSWNYSEYRAMLRLRSRRISFPDWGMARAARGSPWQGRFLGCWLVKGCRLDVSRLLFVPPFGKGV